MPVPMPMFAKDNVDFMLNGWIAAMDTISGGNFRVGIWGVYTVYLLPEFIREAHG